MSQLQQSPSSYRVYFVGEALSIGDMQPVAADDDASAVATAQRMLDSKPGAKGFTVVGPNARIVATRRR